MLKFFFMSWTDWPIDDALLDYKEELSLEMKRQQLQRELDLLQKENHPSSSGSAGSKGAAGSGRTIAASAGAAPPGPPSHTPGSTKAARVAHPPQQVSLYLLAMCASIEFVVKPTGEQKHLL